MKSRILAALLTLVILFTTTNARAVDPKCEVADPIYRDGVGIGWGLFVAEALASWITIPVETWKVFYLEGGNDAWHAGLLWEYDNNFGNTTYWVIHSMNDATHNADGTTGDGPQYGTFDGAFLLDAYKNARRHPGPSFTQVAREEVLQAAAAQISSGVGYPGNWYLLWADFVTAYKSPGSNFRCDGLVEYAYEQAGFDVVPLDSGALLTPYFQAQGGNLQIAADGNWATPPSATFDYWSSGSGDISVSFSERMSPATVSQAANTFSLRVNGSPVAFSVTLLPNSSEPTNCLVHPLSIPASGATVTLYANKYGIRDAAGNRWSSSAGDTSVQIVQFVKGNYVLSVRSSGGITPSIDVSPADLNGINGVIGQTDLQYDPNVTVTLLAASSSGSKAFSSWTGVDNQSGRLATVKMSGNRTVTAFYVDATAQPGSDLSIYSKSWSDTSGNGDGDDVIEGREDVDLEIRLKSTASVQNIRGVLSSSVGQLSISDSEDTWPDIPANGDANCDGNFDLVLNRDSYSGLPFMLRVDYEKGGLPYFTNFTFTKTFYLDGAKSADFDIVSVAIDDSTTVSTRNNADGMIQSGETVHLIPTIRNAGTADATDVEMSICYTNLPAIFELCEVEGYGDIGEGHSVATESLSMRDVRRDFSGNVCLDALFTWDQNTNGQWKVCEIPLTIYPEAWLDIPEETFDFGIASPGSSVTHTTLVVNVGSASLQVTNITTSAADTTWVGPALPWTLAPGQSTNLVVQISTTGLQGQISRQVRVYSTGRVRHPGQDDLLMVSGMVSESVPLYQVPGVSNAGHPDISGDWIVWYDGSSGNSDIYAFNIATDVKRQITTDTNSQFNPRISGNLIVWNDTRVRGTNGDYDVYGYDLNRPDLGDFPVAPGLSAGRAELLGVDGNRVAFFHVYEWLYDSNSPDAADNLYVHTYQGNGLFTQYYTTGFSPGTGTADRQTVNGPGHGNDGDFNEGMLVFERNSLYVNPSTGRWQTRSWTNQVINYGAGETVPRALPLGGYSYEAAASNRFIFQRADANADQIWLWRHPATVQQLTSTAFDHVRDVLAIGGPEGSDCVLYDYQTASRPGLYYLDRSSGQEFVIATNCNPDWESVRMDVLRFVVVNESAGYSLNYGFLKQPDVQVSGPGITITPLNPQEGAPVSVSVLVRNLSGYNQSGNITVNLYDGDPDAVATSLGTPQSFSTLAAHTDRAVVFSNITSLVEGMHSIYAKLTVTTSDAPNNNKAFRALTIGDSDARPPVISNIQVSESGGDEDGLIATDEDAQLNFNVADVSGVASVQVLLDGIVKATSGPLTSPVAALGKLSQGAHNVEIRAVDADLSPSSRTNTVSFSVVNAERIAVTYNSVEATNGAGPLTLGMFNLGSTASQLFIVRNDGEQDLTLGALTVSGGLTTSGPISTQVTPGSPTSFALQPNTSTLGCATGSVSLASSDLGNSPFAYSVRWSVIEPPTAPLLSISSTTNGVFQLAIPSQAGKVYWIQSSSNLVDWLAIRAGTGTGGVIQFQEANAVVVAARFYRALAFSVAEASPHPADLNADFRMTAEEFATYDAAFRASGAWPIPPSLIDANFYSRAHYLLHSGEWYHVDPCQPQPMCWVLGR